MKKLAPFFARPGAKAFPARDADGNALKLGADMRETPPSRFQATKRYPSAGALVQIA
jgi:hypothetical protein